MQVVGRQVAQYTSITLKPQYILVGYVLQRYYFYLLFSVYIILQCIFFFSVHFIFISCYTSLVPVVPAEVKYNTWIYLKLRKVVESDPVSRFLCYSFCYFISTFCFIVLFSNFIAFCCLHCNIANILHVDLESGYECRYCYGYIIL